MKQKLVGTIVGYEVGRLPKLVIELNRGEAKSIPLDRDVEISWEEGECVKNEWSKRFSSVFIRDDFRHPPLYLLGD